MSGIESKRCPKCAALVSADADWCGQCFASLREPEPQPEPASEPVAATSAERASDSAGPKAEAFWPCPVCEGRNPIDADACSTCGTPFATVMRAQTDPRPDVDPGGALLWSLVFPGLGHHKMGRTMDGLARAVLFTVSVGMAIMMVLGGLRNAVTLSVFSLFVLTALGVYGLSAQEARGLSRGGGLLVSSRALMWVLVGVILLSVGALTLAFVTATEG